MSLLPCIWSTRRSRRVDAVLLTLALVCAVVLEALHGHECVGDGCVLCLAAAWAHALLCLCVGVGVARPAVRALRHARTVRTLRIPRRDALPLGTCLSEPHLPAATPLSMGVMLRI